MKSEKRVLGIDVGSTNIKSGWVAEGEITEFKNVPINPEGVVSELVDVIRTYEMETDSIIGVGFPGFINDGKVHSPPNLPSIRELDLQEELREKTHHPVYLFNDADAYILGEALYGAGKGNRIVVGFTLGTGIGGGFIVDGKVYTGSRGFASEYGHMTIDPDGPLCHCGKKGCLEAFVGSYGITERYEVLSRENLTVKEIFDKAKQGEENALKVVNEFGFYLSIGIKNIVEALDPDIVILGGGITKAGDIIIKLIESNHSFSSSRPFEDVKIAIGELPDKGGAIGAAHWANVKHRQ
ncbi:ROK family protein [candidate division WOR-3 bacterium]|nr:ROK family protein [candidate division WOR-3 bacterium]